MIYPGIPAYGPIPLPEWLKNPNKYAPPPPPPPKSHPRPTTVGVLCLLLAVVVLMVAATQRCTCPGSPSKVTIIRGAT